jgi:hypothetical protein|tara:strand:+ start:5970 stop:6272 length:303 start_codon:yes stop_codon:yes gene_type:complete
MANYKLDVSWFINNDNDTVTLSGKNTFTVNASGNYSQKVLGKLFALKKPYIIDEDSIVEVKEVVVGKPKKAKIKKKIKIDEPKEETPQSEESATNTEEGY